MSQSIIALPDADDEIGTDLIPRPRRPHDAQIPFTSGHLAECEDDYLLLAVEVADLFRVEAKTVTRWANSGELESIRTPGNHHRFKAGVVKRAYAGQIEAAKADQ